MIRGPLATTLLILQPVLFYWRVLVTRTRHIPYDIAGFHLPFAAYIAKCMREGVLPLWDPYSYCGYPFHADMQTQLFYPPAWIPILIANARDPRTLYYFYQWLDPLHMMLAGLFTYFLLRALDCSIPAALFGATVYELGGFFASQAQHVGAVASGAWLPLALWSIWKLSRAFSLRWVAILALALAANILAGCAQAAAVVLIAAGLFASGLILSRLANWRLLAGYAAAFLLALGISAVMLMPALQLIESSMAATRSGWLSGAGLPLPGLASLVVPNAYHVFTPFDRTRFKLDTDFTQIYIYCGLIPLVLLLLAFFRLRDVRVRLFLTLTVVCAFWMLGEHTPVYRVLYALLPPLIQGGLYAIWADMAFNLFLAITAALTLHQFFAGKRQAIAWCALLLTLIDLQYFSSDRPMNAAEGSYKMEVGKYGASLERARAVSRDRVPPTRGDSLNHVRFLGPDARQYGLPSATGDNPFVLLRILSLRRLFCGGALWERDIPVTQPDSPLLPLMNVGYLIADQPLEPSFIARYGLQSTGAATNPLIYRTSHALPRFFVVNRVTPARNQRDALFKTGNLRFDPSNEAIVENAPAFVSGATAAVSKVEVVHDEPNRIELNVFASEPSFLVSSEAWYPGWKTIDNGKPTPTVITDAAFRGCFLARGANRIVMSYEPELLWLWSSISAVSLLLALAGVVAPARGRLALTRDNRRRHA